MQTKQPATPALSPNAKSDNTALNDAIRDYVRVHQRRHGQKRTAESLGVPATPCGATWNGATPDAPCPPPFWTPSVAA